MTAAATRDAATALAGRYHQRFPDGTVDGTRYSGEDIVEILPVAPRAAYVRAELSFFNGHRCAVAGIARARGDALVYRERRRAGSRDRCTLTVRRTATALTLRDAGGSCRRYCGSRGGFDSADLPFASRRPVADPARLKASDDYRRAMAEWMR